MSTSDFGQGPKKETVYSGQGPIAGKATVYGRPTIKASEGTLFNGPVGGTVYRGPAGTSAHSPSVGLATPSSNVGARKGARIFYVIAGFTVLRTLLLFAGVQQLTLGANRMVEGNLQSILMINALIIGVFVALGVFTQRGSKTALLIGMLLYGADMVLLLVGDVSANVVYIVVHGLFLYYLFSAYRQVAD